MPLLLPSEYSPEAMNNYTKHLVRKAFLRQQLLQRIIRQRNAKKLIVPNLAAVRAGAAKV
jgi:hypothetical protein